MGEMKPGYYAIETIDPKKCDGSLTALYLPRDVWHQKLIYNPIRFENLRAARHVLIHPKRIYRGIRRDEKDEWTDGWCYVGKPRTIWTKASPETPLANDFVYAVYINERLEIYLWRVEKSDPDDPLSPVDCKTRYGELKWRSTS